MHNKRESLEIVDQTQTPRYVLRSSHCSTSPPSHRRIFTISSTQDFPHREPPLRIWVIQLQSTQLLSPTNTTSTQEVRHNNDHLYTQRDRHLAKTRLTSQQRDKAQRQHNNHNHLYTQRDINATFTITSTLRGISTQPPQSPLTRGISQSKEGYNTWWSLQPQTNFPHKIRSNRLNRYDRSSVRK